jgi:hypothetical protein
MHKSTYQVSEKAKELYATWNKMKRNAPTTTDAIIVPPPIIARERPDPGRYILPSKPQDRTIAVTPVTDSAPPANKPKQALPLGRTLVYRGQKFTGPLDQEGKGTFKSENGDLYTGEYKSGSMHGLGVLKANISGIGTYSGQWFEGKRQGDGVHRLVDDSTYYCRFKNDLYEGPGVYHGSDGQEFRGHFSCGKRKGHGVQRLADGTVSHGQFNDLDNSEILHRVFYLEGDVYRGQCRNDKPDGYGVKCYADGRKYCGEFRRGKRHGQGQLDSPKQPTFFGAWNDDLAGEPMPSDQSVRVLQTAKIAEASPAISACRLVNL